jgi:response regulator RpfG family c-di-GMP phosphodiesterase
MNEFSSRKNTILFVDDEDVILDIAGEYFQGKGYQVLTARNGREAMEAMKTHSTPIDCCFTDINMPEMDGLALAECIRKWDNTIPVVIMTGYPSVDNTLRTLKNGVVDFLIKPINLEQMFLCLQRVLRERELFVHKLLLKQEMEGKKRLEQLNKELLERIEELNVLNRIMSDLMSLRTGSEVFDHMVETAVSLTRAGGGLLYAAGTSVPEPFLLSAAEPEKKGCPGAEAMSGGAGKSLTDACLFPNALIAEIAADEIPLLSSGNGRVAGLPDGVCSFVAVPVKIRDMVFGVLVVFSTTKARCFAETDLYYLSFMVHHAAYQVENLALYENIYENLLSTLSAFVSTVEARDAYTRAHSQRVTQMAVIMAEKWGCAKEEIDVIDFAGRLHDIGKIGIRDDILLKPGPLTPSEYEVIKQHPVIGESIVSQLGIWRREQKIIRHHHEWYDGTGYPDGLKAEEIPLLARILAVTDAYDAMITRRPYRDVMNAADALAVIREAAGSQFDPLFVDLFLKLHGQGAFDEM